MKTLFKAFIKVAVMLSLLLIFLLAGLALVPDSGYKQLAIKGIKVFTGRQVTISQLSTVRSLHPSVEIKGFKLENPTWSQKQYMIEAERLNLGISLPALLFGQVKIENLSLDKPIINLEKNQQGQTSWVFSSRANKGSATSPSPVGSRHIKKSLGRFRLLSMKLNAAQLEYVDRLTDKQYQVNLPLFNLEKTSAKKQLINVRGSINQLPLVIEGKVDLPDKPDSNQPLPFDLAASLGEAKLNFDGEFSQKNNRWLLNSDINLAASRISELFTHFGFKKAPTGSFALQAKMAGTLGRYYSLEIEKAALESSLLNFNIAGKVENLVTGKGTDLTVQANATNLHFIDQLLSEQAAKKLSMPKEWGPIKASAKLTRGAGQYALEDIEVLMSGESSVKATGSIGQLINFDSMQLNVEAKLANLQELTSLGAKRLPSFGPVTTVGQLNWRKGVLSLKQAKGGYKGQYGEVSLEGDIDDLIVFDGVNLNTQMKLPNLAVAELFSGVKMPKIGPFSAKAQLVSPSEKDLSLKDFSMNYDYEGIKLLATGSIDSLIKSRAKLDLNLNAEAASLASLNQPLGLSTLPDLGPVTANAKISGITKEIEITALKAKVADSVLKGEITGKLGKIFNFKGFDVNTKLSTPSVKSLLKRFKINAAADKPGSLKGHVFYKDDSIYFKDSELKLSGDIIKGDISFIDYLNKQKRSKLSGQIIITKFDLMALSDGKAKQQDRSEKPPARDRIIPRQPLPYDFIRNNDIDLSIDIGLLRDKLFDLSDLKIKLLADDGIFKLGPVDADVSGGQAQLELLINAKAAPAITTLKTNIDGFKISKTSVFRGSDLIDSQGDAFLNLNLTGKGDSLANILASSNGEGYLYFEGLNIKQGALSLVSSDVLKQLIDALNPFKKNQKDTQINCAALTLNIKDGLVSTPYGFAAEAIDFSIMSNGNLNFATEDMDLQFKTNAKKGLGLGFGKLATLVQMKGKLASPSITLNPKGILEVWATVGAALATGGGSLIAQGLYDKVKANSELCSHALGR